MAMHELELPTLDNLDDGRLALAWKKALQRAALDCEDRPGDNKPRIVTLQCEIIPVLAADGSGQLDTVHVSFQVQDKVPTRKTKKYDMSLRRGGVLAFNDLSDEDVHQKTIDEI